jgi:sulfide-dependent adenosine diphosphate thiazole synthase
VAKSKRIFQPGGEKEVSRAIVESWTRKFVDSLETEVVIVGSGPSGLIAAADLAKAGVKVLVLERNPYMGGGFWVGGFMMDKLTVRVPADKILAELGVPLEKYSEGIFVADAPLCVAKCIVAAYEAGATLLNLTSVVDVVLREKHRVAGVVINWTAVSYLPRPIAIVDPLAIECKIVIDATGHDAGVANKLQDRGIIKLKGEGAMWIEESEDLVVSHTGLVHPGLILSGMAVAAFHGLPRMGPTFGSMLLSGKRAAEVALKLLRS